MYIFIKSFNRPYYLDRCLHSIERFVVGEYKIVVLDDGTPEKYLEKIRMQYPHIEILRSEMADEKAAKIQNHALDGSPVTGLKIPSKFWRESIDAIAGHYILLLEDDMWLLDKMHIDELEQTLTSNNIASLKLNTFDNPRFTAGTKAKIAPDVFTIDPRLITRSPWVFRNILARNPFKILSLLRLAGLYNPASKINYYSLYTVAGGIYRKDYYKFIWEKYDDIRTEDGQLYQTLVYWRNGSGRFAYSQKKMIQTSFSSSATNSFSDIDFDVFRFSHLMNEAWYHGALDVMDNFPRDFSAQTISKFIGNDDVLTMENWYRWADRFKQQYIADGHNIDSDG